VIVVLGAAAIMGAVAAAVAGTGRYGHFTDAAGISHAIAAHSGQVVGALFAIALLDASIIGAFAVSLATAYAVSDVTGMNHSLHGGVGHAKGFYALYAALIGGAAAIVLIPRSPLGLITEGVQVLCGMLLPVATVFLLLLCNDRAVLGPWANGRKTNVFTGAVIALLIILSVVLTASVLFPGITAAQIEMIMAGCALGAAATGAVLLTRNHRRNAPVVPAPVIPHSAAEKLAWRMPPVADLPAPVISGGRKWGLMALQAYLALAMVGVIVKIVFLAIH
jgi:natural resistance-associated macrophage protein